MATWLFWMDWGMTTWPFWIEWNVTTWMLRIKWNMATGLVWVDWHVATWSFWVDWHVATWPFWVDWNMSARVLWIYRHVALWPPHALSTIQARVWIARVNFCKSQSVAREEVRQKRDSSEKTRISEKQSKPAEIECGTDQCSKGVSMVSCQCNGRDMGRNLDCIEKGKPTPGNGGEARIWEKQAGSLLGLERASFGTYVSSHLGPVNPGGQMHLKGCL